MSVAPASTRLDLDVLLGDWRNTNPEGKLKRIVVSSDKVSVDDWGSVAPSFYSFTFEDPVAGAFSAFFNLGFWWVRLQANVKAGVLVVVVLTEFYDSSGRSNFFDREFFHRVTS